MEARNTVDEGHYVIALKIPMTVERYKELLKRIVLEID
jgi:hypothetical protein